MDVHIDTKFLDLVEKMRQAQNDYFKLPSQQNLRKAKDLEGQVDKWILDYREDLRKLNVWARPQ